MNIIYARRSNRDEERLQRQIERVEHYCKTKNIAVGIIYKEKVTARDEKEQREELITMIKSLNKGDLIICENVSRLSRRGEEVVKKALDLIFEKNANIYFLQENITANKSMSKENEKIIMECAKEAKRNNYLRSETTTAGKQNSKRKKAMKKGKQKDENMMREAVEFYLEAGGARKKTDICKKYNFSRNTFDKYLKIYTDQQKDNKLLQGVN